MVWCLASPEQGIQQREQGSLIMPRTEDSPRHISELVALMKVVKNPPVNLRSLRIIHGLLGTGPQATALVY